MGIHGWNEGSKKEAKCLCGSFSSDDGNLRMMAVIEFVGLYMWPAACHWVAALCLLDVALHNAMKQVAVGRVVVGVETSALLT